MKKKFKLIVPSFLTLIFCLLLIAGSTYAIFSSQDQASIEVTSGKVELTAVFGATTVYSAEADDNIEDTADNYAGTASAFGVTSKYKYVEQTEVASINEKQFKLFVNKNGGANLTGGDLTLLNMTPGDRVDANLTITNSSNVDIKYRVMCAVASGYDSTILEVLEVEANGVDLTSSVRNWTTLPFDSANSPKIVEIPVSVVLPIETINKYQEMNTKLVFTVQAVQANAKTLDDVVNVEITKHIDQEEVTTVLESLDKKAKAEVPNSAVSTATSLTLTVEEKANGSVALQSNQGQKAFDVDVTVTTVTGNDVQQASYNNPDKPIKVTINVGSDLVGVRLFHTHGNPAVTTEITDFEYNSATGTITFEATEFSEYSVTYLMPIVDTVNNVTYIPQEDGSYKNQDTTDTKAYKYDSSTEGVRLAVDSYGFFDSYIEDEGEETEHWVHEIKTKEHFVNMMYHIKKVNNSINVPTINNVDYTLNNLGNKNTEYIIIQDIDLQNQLWFGYDSEKQLELNEIIKNTIFTGKLIGVSNNSRVLISNLSVTNTAEVFGNQALFGLLPRSKDVEFKNIELSNIVLDNALGDGVSLFTLGHKSNDGQYYKFSNVVINDTCSILSGTDNCGAFLAFGRYAKEIEFTNCVNNADVLCTGHAIGGFVGTASNNAPANSKLTMNNCVNNGYIRGDNQVAGFFGYAGGGSNRTHSLTNCVNNGTIETLNGENSIAIGAFYGTDTAVANTSTRFVSGNVNTGKIVLTGNAYRNKGLGTEELQKDSGIVFRYTENDEVFTLNGLNNDNYDTFFSKFVVKGAEVLSLDFNSNNQLYNKATNIPEEVLKAIDHVEVTISLSTGPVQIATGNAYASQIGMKPIYSNTFSNLSEMTNNIVKITKIGYFKPSNDTLTGTSVEYSNVALYQTYEYFMLNHDLLGTSGYELGYVIQNNEARYLFANEDAVDIYYALVKFRCKITCNVNCYDVNGNVIVCGQLTWGNNGDDTTLLPYSA